MQGKSKWELAEFDYAAGMKYREIAEKYGVSINTVKSWKVRHSWDRKGDVQGERKCTHTVRKKARTKKASAQKARIQKEREQEERDEEKRKAIQTLAKVDKINERQRLFALYYFQTHNATASYQRVYGCTRAAASASAYKLLKNPAIVAAIREIQADRDATLLLTAGDVVDLYMRIAFNDYWDMMRFKDGKVTLKDLEQMDTQLIESIKVDDRGVISLKTADRMKALHWLANYFELNPSDRHRAAYQAKMAELREREIKSKEDGW